MTAHILTIGDELLIGQVINTNQTYIGEQLTNIGIAVRTMVTVGDDLGAILEALARAWESGRVVIVTGGLGPTHDDITKKAVCSFFHTDLVGNDEIREHIEALMRTRNLPWTAAAEEQTMVPRAATVFPNPVGTAPGLLFGKGDKQLFVLPGVPYEMKEMIDRWVIPSLAKAVTGSVIRQRTLRTTGIPESFLARQLGNLDDLLGGAKLAFLPSAGGVRMRISVHAATAEVAERTVAEVEQRIRAKVSKYIYGIEAEELEDVVGRLLSERKRTIAVAESCTGGLIAHRLTNVSGSSAYLERGVVAYSNLSKSELLGVPPALLAAHGAVSKETAEAMAVGVRRIAHTDIGLSTTGIAGPTGGTLEKPVGLVWIALADERGCVSLKFTFGDGRLRVKERAAHAALNLVRRRLLDIE